MCSNQSENPAKRAKIESEFLAKTLEDTNHDHIVCSPGELFGPYKIEKVVGEGSFGRVAIGMDMVTKKCAALKIIKNDKMKKKIAMKEIVALKSISNMDPLDESLCIKMLDYFTNDTYVCIVFPVLGLSVFDFIKMTNFEPFPIDQVQHISFQLCKAVNFLHRNKMTHTDLKPENILFVNSDFATIYDPEKKCDVKRIVNTDIRLIDFGLLTRDKDQHNSVVSTRFYRAPEVILQLGWSQPCDAWSIGCILVELCFGTPLFDTHEDREHLAIMEKTLGVIPLQMANKSPTKYFLDGLLDWVWKGWEGMEQEISEYYMPLRGYMLGDSDDDVVLFDLIEKLLEYDPAKRIVLSEAVEHQFFIKTSQNEIMEP